MVGQCQYLGTKVCRLLLRRFRDVRNQMFAVCHRCHPDFHTQSPEKELNRVRQSVSNLKFLNSLYVTIEKTF